MPLRYDELFNDHFIRDLLLSNTVKEFWKSVSIWRSYSQEYIDSTFWFRVANGLVLYSLPV